jgi:predicted phage baseplate assembly protein
MSFDGFDGFIITSLDEIILEPAYKDDELVSETVEVEEASGDPMVVKLKKALKNSYDRTTVSIYANVARATHGETVKEIIGSGNADQPYQRFTLRQPPLTYVSSPNPGGAESTLEVRVNDLLWNEVPTLYGHGPYERIYITKTENDGKTTIQFGDGRTGARLPTGQENVHATYRKGIGLAGLVKANQLKLLMMRPLGVKDVNNLLDSTGGADREYLEDARLNAPLKVLTLDRVVSLRDYEDFARAYAGIAKALATWTWSGERRGVFITVAGPRGALVMPDSELYKNLLTALKNAGDPSVLLRVESYIPALFSLEAYIKIDPDYSSEKVMDAVKRSLLVKFSFEARSFGQSVMLSEAMAIMAAVPGVMSVNVYELRRIDGKGGDGLKRPLPATMPKAGANTEMLAAEILMLDSHALNLKVMQ